MILHRFPRAAFGVAIGLVVAAAPRHVLAGPKSTAGPRSAAGPASAASEPSLKEDQKPAKPAHARGFRVRTDSALKAPFPATSADRKVQAEALVSLYRQIDEAKEVVPIERNRLQTRLKSRLARLADAIALDVKQARTAGQPQTGNRPSTANQPADNRSSTGAEAASASQTASAGANGGAPQDDGQALVELIQATIAPQSWDVNGGPGTIVYWPAWHVLVVRQTDDVHEQIGGVARGMRK